MGTVAAFLIVSTFVFLIGFFAGGFAAKRCWEIDYGRLRDCRDGLARKNRLLSCQVEDMQTQRQETQRLVMHLLESVADEKANQ